VADVRRVQAENLRHLKNAGVTIVIGTDGGAGKIMSEVDDLQATGVFTNLEILHMLTGTTPEVIFPKRRIGLLTAGYEASFLVLGADPIHDLSSLKAIQTRMKSGEIVK
jgi:imidazolonepropionase-like amidohydrolase